MVHEGAEMCTMTWWHNTTDYGVFFNRDERRTRPLAEAPKLRGEGVLAPRDPAGGGSWMAANRHGLILCLLNRWQSAPTGGISRGKLVMDLADAADFASLQSRLDDTDLRRFSGFTLVAVDRSGARRWDWESGILRASAAECPVTSSSFDPEKVAAARRRRFAECVPDPSPDSLERFHAEGADAYSVRMCRPDAQTWSRSRIDVTGERLSWRYLDEFPNFERVPIESISALDLLPQRC